MNSLVCTPSSILTLEPNQSIFILSHAVLLPVAFLWSSASFCNSLPISSFLQKEALLFVLATQNGLLIDYLWQYRLMVRIQGSHLNRVNKRSRVYISFPEEAVHGPNLWRTSCSIEGQIAMSNVVVHGIGSSIQCLVGVINTNKIPIIIITKIFLLYLLLLSKLTT